MYYVQENDKIVICDADKNKLIDTLKFMPQYKELGIKYTKKNIILYKNKLVFESDVEEEIEADREVKFNKEFFHTSLGYIRRSVTMADGSHKDFLSDLLPVISMGIQGGQPVEIITYDKPPFDEDITDWTPYQHHVPATAQFIQECFIQLSNDFLPRNEE